MRRPSACAARSPPAWRCARRHDCQLIVNDYWREALELGADYIHLGQEDLAGADVAAIHAKGARLGISTHSEDELAIALAAKPDYVALGPIYETRLKVMKWAPQGLDRVADWKAAHRRPAAGRHRRHHAGAGRRRGGGRRRQRRRDHRFLHASRPARRGCANGSPGPRAREPDCVHTSGIRSPQHQAPVDCDRLVMLDWGTSRPVAASPAFG